MCLHQRYISFIMKNFKIIEEIQIKNKKLNRIFLLQQFILIQTILSKEVLQFSNIVIHAKQHV